MATGKHNNLGLVSDHSKVQSETSSELSVTAGDTLSESGVVEVLSGDEVGGVKVEGISIAGQVTLPCSLAGGGSWTRLQCAVPYLKMSMDLFLSLLYWLTCPHICSLCVAGDVHHPASIQCGLRHRALSAKKRLPAPCAHLPRAS